MIRVEIELSRRGGRRMTTCQPCEDYLAANRTRLLRPLGLWVQRSGRPPRVMVEALRGHYHRRGHRA